jgi:hypothetical protein
MKSEPHPFWRWIAHPLRELDRSRLEEAACLRRQITTKALPLVKDEKQLDCFLTFRFEAPFLRHSKRGPLYGRAFTYLSVAAIAAGVASSAISADPGSAKSLRWLLFSLGLVVAITTSINQLWKPAQRSVGAYRAGNALRREGWDYVNERGRYQGMQEARKAYDLLLDQIREIQAQVDSIDEVQAEIPGSGNTDPGPANGNEKTPPSGGLPDSP